MDSISLVRKTYVLMGRTRRDTPWPEGTPTSNQIKCASKGINIPVAAATVVVDD